MTHAVNDLTGRVALVAGGTRGAGRGIAVELGAAGATVYVTGRTTSRTTSPMDRREAIEGTAPLVGAPGGGPPAARGAPPPPGQVPAPLRPNEAHHTPPDVPLKHG